MPDAVIDWKQLVTHGSWLEAVVEGEGNATGVIENIQQKGVYVRVRGCDLLPEDQVRINICVRDLDKVHLLVTLTARVVKADKGGAYFRFRPMSLSEHAMLIEIIDYGSAYDSGRKTPHEEMLDKGAFGLPSSYE